MPIETIIDRPELSDAETLADSGFYWRQTGDIKVLVCRPLEDAGFVNGFSTRLGGVSPFPSGDLNLAGFNEDTPANIFENRRRYLSMFDGSWRLATVWQVHGDDIKTIRSLDEIGNSEEKCDAITSNTRGILAGVKTADCVPVLIGDPATGAFAAVHAGWRGTVRSIVIKALSDLVANFGSDPANVVAAIGPAACGQNYEIGKDVVDEFAAKFNDFGKYFKSTRPGHALADLHLANSDQLLSAGVRKASIYTAPYCTMERPDLFFSYRVEKRKFGKTGRLLSVIGRR